MNLHVPISEDLIGILDRVLDKGIVVDTWIPLELQGKELWVADPHPSVISTAVSVGYGEHAHWEEDKKGIDVLFPYWRRDLWTK
jgi:hypothetical protein